MWAWVRACVCVYILLYGKMYITALIILKAVMSSGKLHVLLRVSYLDVIIHKSHLYMIIHKSLIFI